MRALIAEDDAVSQLLLTTVLKKAGYEPVAVTDGLKAWDELNKPDAPILVILDWMMPGIDGLEVLRRVRALPTERPPYILMLTANSQKQDIIKGLDSGANDYLTKPFDAEILRARLDAGRRMIELQEELVRSRETLTYLATHDPLTELPNRRAVLERLSEEFIRARRHGHSLCVGLVDIDHFKMINDTYGHQAGDDLLRELAKLFQKCCREYDIVGRLGGDEFLIVIPLQASSDATHIFDRFRIADAGITITTRAGAVSVTLSIGVAADMETVTPEDMLSMADAALYKAKESGRNRIVLAE